MLGHMSLDGGARGGRLPRRNCELLHAGKGGPASALLPGGATRPAPLPRPRDGRCEA